MPQKIMYCHTIQSIFPIVLALHGKARNLHPGFHLWLEKYTEKGFMSQYPFVPLEGCFHYLCFIYLLTGT